MSYRHCRALDPDPDQPCRLLLATGDAASLRRLALLCWWEGAALELEAADGARVLCCRVAGRLRVEDLARAAGCVVREIHMRGRG